MTLWVHLLNFFLDKIEKCLFVTFLFVAFAAVFYVNSISSGFFPPIFIWKGSRKDLFSICGHSLENEFSYETLKSVQHQNFGCASEQPKWMNVKKNILIWSILVVWISTNYKSARTNFNTFPFEMLGYSENGTYWIPQSFGTFFLGLFGLKKMNKNINNMYKFDPN